jgi:hypothetical protein
LRTVTITSHAELCVRTERSAQQTWTIFTGPPAALYLLAQVFPNAVQRCGVVSGAARDAAAASADAETSAPRTARISAIRATRLIVAAAPVGGKWDACRIVSGGFSFPAPDETQAQRPN